MLTCQSVNLEKLSTLGRWRSNVPWHLRAPALAAVFLLSILSLGGIYTPIAQSPLDPVLATPAQDEALYTHGILRMANGEDWLTPHFLGRPLLVKPPLLQWLSAGSLKVFGYHVWALRLPGILAAATVMLIVYRGTGPVGWLLLCSLGLWRARAGLVMMDDLLTLWYVLAVALIAKDPKLAGHWAAWGFGILVGFAVMTKWFAGVLPLALLLWARPPLRRWVEAGAAFALLVTPWHLYQFLVNHDWFLAEYLGVELLGFAMSAPVQASNEGHEIYYLTRLLWLLPLAAPLILRRFNATWLVWCGVLLAAIFAYSYQNATYLVPLAPALLLCHRGAIHWGFAPLALLGLLGWPAGVAVRPIGNEFQGREVLHLDPDDQLRTSLLPGATVRYIFLTSHLPPNGPLDFERLGIAKRVSPFLAAPDAKVDAVLASDLAELRTLIERSPQRDFLLPPHIWAALAMRVPHEAILGIKIWLKSREPQPGPRPNQFPLLSGPGFAK